MAKLFGRTVHGIIYYRLLRAYVNHAPKRGDGKIDWVGGATFMKRACPSVEPKSAVQLGAAWDTHRTSLPR